MTLNPDWVNAALGVGGSFLALVIWLVRLEGKVKAMDKDFDKMEKTSETTTNKLFERLSTIEISLAKIEGKLSINDKPTT